MRHHLICSLACLSVLGCGTTNPTNPNDGGTNDGVTDAAPGDTFTCPEAGADPGLAGANPPVGKLLQQGNDLSVRGVTSDGYVIYSDDAALTLHAIPLAGGAVQELGALGSKFWVTLGGNVVFIWSNVSDANVGALSTWSAATGLHSIASASLGIDAAASPSGDRILYVDHVDASAATGDVYVAATDGSGAVKLVSSASISGCNPDLGFAGSYAVASHCEAQTNSIYLATISSFLGPAWTRVDLATKSENYWVGASSEVLVSKEDGTGLPGTGVLVVPVAGGTPTTIDITGFLGALTSDGKNALYSTKSGALRRSPVTSPSPTTLVPSNFGGFWALSPDEKWVLYFSALGPSGADIYMASAVTPGASTTLSSTLTGALYGAAFTADSSHVLYSTNIDGCTSVGALQALAIGAASPQVLGQNVWVDWSVGASKVVIVDNFVSTGELRFGRADIEWVDLAKGSTPTRLVDRADAVIGLSPAADQFVYVWSARPGSLAGLYVAPLP